MPDIKTTQTAREAAALQGIITLSPYFESWQAPSTDEIRALLVSFAGLGEIWKE
ncbi:hypothetical protein [Huaxiibacter chinensis]|jgi:hypothetical protein|uniref:hypothetical protein n=1 Tax=Huaxiibacter chinensis TaxID=2899785 RepID=UPI003D31CA8C